MKSLENRLAVVTGGGSGIGRATCIALARQGCDLEICDVDEDGLKETAAAVRAQGRQAHTRVVDVADRAQMRAWADEVGARHGRVDVLVNNAGVTVTSLFEDHSLEDWDWIVGINFWGVVHGCKLFLPHLKRSQRAHIVNISSVLGLIGVPHQSSYCATKFAVRGLSEALWVELREHGIGVTSVHPGGVRTGIAAAARGSDPDTKRRGVDLIARASVTPDECAALIVRAIKKDRMRQLVAREAYVIDLAKRLSHTLSQHLVTLGYRRLFSRSRPDTTSVP